MRKIDLSHQHNIRDIGGLTGFKGKKVKYGKLFRGGSLAKVSDSDIKTINSLKLTDLIDFRSALEFEKRPSYPFMGVTFHNLPTFEPENQEALKDKNDSDDSNLLWFLGDNIDGYAHMVKTYLMMLLSPMGINAYKEFFRILTKDPNRVVYFHCSQGKDRTGVAAYLLEIALGVSTKDAIEDYLLSNEAMKDKIVVLKNQMKNRPFYDAQYEKSLEEVFSANLDYLNTVIKEVENRYGSLIEYMIKVLEVDIDKLREYYLE